MAEIVEAIKAQLAEWWLPIIYEQRVRSERTRSIKLEIPKRENDPQIHHTLLGIELKVGRRRISCPDLATARYIRVFARLGCREFAVPYDISRISGIADDLETSWQRTLVVLDGFKRNDVERVRPTLVKSMRGEIEAIGPGEPMPLFDRETRQRPPQS